MRQLRHLQVWQRGRSTRAAEAARLVDEAATGAGQAGTVYPLNAAVTHREWGSGVVMRHEPDRITVLFAQVGYRTLALAALEADAGLLVVTQKPKTDA